MRLSSTKTTIVIYLNRIRTSNEISFNELTFLVFGARHISYSRKSPKTAVTSILLLENRSTDYTRFETESISQQVFA